MVGGAGVVTAGLGLAEKRGVPAAWAGSVRASDVVTLDAVGLSTAIRRRQVSCREVMDAFLDHIERLNPRVNAIVSLADRELLVRQAARRDAQLRRGRVLGWMHGFPQAVKDLSDAKGFRTTRGSPLFREGVADGDDLFVERIKAAGAIVIGKTNTPEFGLGSHTYNPVFGTTLNAYDQTKTAGGSSGGAAVALALRMLPVADGSDFGGSLRNPAAYNNVIGFRPSYGRVPGAEGDLWINQLGVSGPMGRSVRDVAMLLATMAGPTRALPYSIEQDPERFTGRLERDFRGTRIAWLGDWDGYLPMEPGVLELCRRSFRRFEAIGCRVDEALPDYSPRALWERVWLPWRHWLSGGGLAALYDDPAKRALMKPEAIFEVEGFLRLTARDVHRASAARSDWYRAVLGLFQRYDFLMLPSAQVFPFDADLTWPREIAGRSMDTYHRWMEVVTPATLSGCPVIDVPVGFTRAGLPMGMQIIGRMHGERSVLQLAHAYEQETRWVKRRPPPLLA
jgi:amidase